MQELRGLPVAKKMAEEAYQEISEVAKLYPQYAPEIMDMIEKAGISLAMENATDELKAAADRTICQCKEHSAKYILENIIEL